MLIKTFLFASLVGLLVTCLSGPVSGYIYGDLDENRGEAWCCDTVNYYVNPAEPSLNCGGVLGASFQFRISMAASAWNNLGTTFQLVSAGETQVNCIGPGSHGNCYGPQDGQNTVAMATGCNWSDNNVIAYSTWWFWTDGDTAGCIFEGDVCFNDEVTWYNNGGDCSGACYDLVSVAMHELGHWISSDHENDIAALGYKPVMYYQFNDCEERRTITADDSALIHWAYGANSAIALPARRFAHHDHPPYDTPPAHDECFPLGCQHVQWDPCVLVCPASDVTYTVTANISGHPVCDTDLLSLTFPSCPVDSCPGEEPDWPYVFPDSCDPATGTHYFTVDAKLLDCVECEGWLTLSTMWCGPITARFLDTDGDGCVTQSDFVGGRLCDDLNCNFASDIGDSLVWAEHVNHCCGACCNTDGIRGDADNDCTFGCVNVADLSFLVAYLFPDDPQNPGPRPSCCDEGNADADCTFGCINVGDLSYLVAYLFPSDPQNPGPPPPSCDTGHQCADFGEK